MHLLVFSDCDGRKDLVRIAHLFLFFGLDLFSSAYPDHRLP
jgi:hypothetical protein